MLTSLSIQSQFGLFWLIFVSVVIVFFTIWSYRWTRPPIPRYQRYLLILLRSVSLLSLWLLVNQFTLNWSMEKNKPYHVAILVDDSQSMGITDNTGNRPDQVVSVINEIKQQIKDRNFTTDFYLFGSELKEGTGYSFKQPLTNFEDVFFKLFNRNKNIPDEVILVSDGNINNGSSPIRIIKDRFIPVHCLAIGDSTYPKDISVYSLIHPLKSYVNDEINLSATIRGVGVPATESEVVLFDEAGNEVERKNIRFDAAGFSEKIIDFSVQPNRAGKNSWTIRVESKEGEESSNNNSRSFVVDVLEKRKNILVFTPEPNAEASAFSSSLEDLDDYETTVIVGGGKTDKLLRGIWPDTTKSFDAIVLYLQGYWGTKSYDWFNRMIQQDIPVIYFTGEKLDSRIQSLVNQHVSKLRSNSETGENTVVPAISHPVFTRETTWVDEVEGTLPPMELSRYITSNGEVLAFAQAGTTRIPVLTVTGENPRTLFFSATGLWRWKMYINSQTESTREFDILVGRIMRWLTTDATQERIFIESTKDIYFGDEDIELVANVYNESQIADEDVIVSAEVAHAGETYTFELNPSGNGIFNSRFVPWGSGHYSVTANIRNNNELLTRYAEFFVDEYSIELSDTRMRPDILKEVADISGGGYYLPGDETSLLERINPTEDLEVINGSWRPFGLSLTLLIIIAALGIEWLFRIRKGMV